MSSAFLTFFLRVLYHSFLLNAHSAPFTLSSTVLFLITCSDLLRSSSYPTLDPASSLISSALLCYSPCCHTYTVYLVRYSSLSPDVSSSVPRNTSYPRIPSYRSPQTEWRHTSNRSVSRVTKFRICICVRLICSAAYHGRSLLVTMQLAVDVGSSPEVILAQ